MSRLIITFINDPVLGSIYVGIQSFALPTKSKKRGKRKNNNLNKYSHNGK